MYSIGDLAYMGALGQLGNIGSLPEPFPTNYGIYGGKSLDPSTAELQLLPMCSASSGQLCRKSFDQTTTVKHALAYAAGSWHTVKYNFLPTANSTTKQSFDAGMYFYRLAYDVAMWGQSLGVDAAQTSRFVEHIKTLIEAGNVHVRRGKNGQGVESTTPPATTTAVTQPGTTFKTIGIKPAGSSAQTAPSMPVTSEPASPNTGNMFSRLLGAGVKPTSPSSPTVGANKAPYVAIAVAGFVILAFFGKGLLSARRARA